MRTITRTVIALAAAAFATQAAAQVTLYEREGFEGRPLTTNQPRIESIYATSVVVMDNNLWEVCDDTMFRGVCIRLMQGRYPSVASMGLRNPVASIRLVVDGVPGPRADLGDDRRDYRRRSGERVFEVPVANVRAVVGAPEQRCWVEREQVSSGRPSVGGAIAGAVIGGILGHQIGHGGGRDVATVGGAVAGGAIGANVARDRGYQDVQRCTTASSQAPAYWDVTYYFRGEQHRVQMSEPPGPTIQVNESGEPRA